MSRGSPSIVNYIARISDFLRAGYTVALVVSYGWLQEILVPVELDGGIEEIDD